MTYKSQHLVKSNPYIYMEKIIFKLQGFQTELKEMEHELNTLREQQIFKPKHKNGTNF